MPFPVWFCADCDRPVVAALAGLPVDPLADTPPVDTCPGCGGGRLVGDPDVMDTWMTSSLTPQINDGSGLNDFRPDPSLAPMSLRVQAFEIIRTWLFYSLVQSEFHFQRVPWRTVLISGWGLNEQGKKIAKRHLDQSRSDDGYNRYLPDDVMAKYGADAVRLWATKGRSGTDLRYNEKDVRAGCKFSVKLWNVGRFLQMNLGDFDPATTNWLAAHQRSPVDRWLLSHLADTIAQTTAAFEDYDFMQAYQAASRLFWGIYCDRYLEMVKDRFGVPDEHSDTERDSARWTLRESYRVLLGLFAPFAPFITEHMYQRFYHRGEAAASLHRTSWPTVDERWLSDRAAIDHLATILDAVRALRSRHQLGNSARISKLTLQPHTEESEALLALIAEPLRAAARAHQATLGPAQHPSGVENITVDITI